MSTIDAELYETLARASQGAYEEFPLDTLGFSPIETMNDPDTGFAFTIYKNSVSEEYLFAFRGTEVSSQDYYTNLNAGTLQWNVSNSQDVAEKISFYTGGKPEAIIHLTGHSLGGALAQFAAYEYAAVVRAAEVSGESIASFDLVTFNALGGELALREMSLSSEDYDPSLADTINAAHFKIEGDVVSRLGDNHIGGSLLVIDKQTNSNFAAHSIANFTGSNGGSPVTQSEYEQATVEESYLQITQLLNVSGIVASFGDDGEFSPEEALLRTVSGFSFALANADSTQLTPLVAAFFGDPSDIGQRQFDAWIFLGEQAIDTLQATRPLRFGGNGVGVYVLTLANVMQTAAQFWEEHPGIADVLGGSIDLYVEHFAKPATAVARASLDYALEFEFSATEYPEVVEYVAKSFEWVDLYFAQQPLNKFYIQGNSGDNVLSGNDDYWPGKDPDDYILGHAGNDVLEGGAGRDLLDGGSGADRYLWNMGDGDDVIGGYDDAGDRIVVNDVDLATLQFERSSADSSLYTADSNPEIRLHYEGDFLTVYIGSGPDAGSITVNQYTPATGADYGIVLNDYSLSPAPVTDATVYALGDSDEPADSETRPYADQRQQYSQRGLDWSAISITFVASDVSGYSGNSIHALSSGVFEGGPVDDYMMGDSGHNGLLGLGGDDRLDGKDGHDFLAGWAGSDTVSGGNGVDLIFGSTPVGLGEYYSDLEYFLDPFEPQFYLPQVSDVAGDVNLLSGGGDSDYIGGGEYTDEIDGGPGNDYLLGGTGADYISGGADHDTIFGDSALGRHLAEDNQGELQEIIDIAYASGDDSVAEYDDVIHAGPGNDTVWGELGDDEIHGGLGNDSLVGDRRNDPDILTSSLQAYADTSPSLDVTLHGDDRLFGGEGGDLLLGLGGDDYLAGGPGTDSLKGGVGNDTYYHQPGDGLDYIEDDEGTHTLVLAGVSLSEVEIFFQGHQVRVSTESGEEGFYFSRGEWEKVQIALNTPDAVIERSRFDTHYYDTAGNLSLTVAGTDQLPEAERDELMTIDSSVPDKPRIVVAPDVGALEIEALTEDTALVRIINGVSLRIIVELTLEQIAQGLEVIQYDGPSLSLIGFSGNVLGSAGNDRIVGSDSEDNIYGSSGDDLIEGRSGNDELYGGSGNDVLRGEGGDDELRGWTGSDFLYGGAGNDSLYGELGADYLDGGEGNDDLHSGGGGTDTLYFDAGDGQDRLLGSDVDYLVFGPGVGPESVALNYTGSSSFNFRIEYGSGDSVTSSGETDSYWLKGITVDGLGIPLLQHSDLTNGDFYDTRSDDVFETGNGNDTIHIEGWGDDVYRFHSGDGQDTIMVDNGYSPEAMGEIRLGASVDLSSVSYEFSGASATISYGSGDQITLTPDTVYSSTDNTLTRFAIVSELDPSWVPEIRAEAYGGDLYGTYSHDHIIGNDNVEAIFPGYGNDIIEAGGGPDRVVLNDVYVRGAEGIGHKHIWGQGGNDAIDTPLFQGLTFHYDLGDGKDTINYDWSFSGLHPYRFDLNYETNTAAFQTYGQDVLAFGDGISLAELRFLRTGSSLVISLPGASISMTDFFHAWDVDAGDGGELFSLLDTESFQLGSLRDPVVASVLPKVPISAIQFSDGTRHDMTLVLSTLLEEIPPVTELGTEGDDILYATSGDDVIYGLAGDDTIRLDQSAEGKDHFVGGEGYDQLLGPDWNVDIALDGFAPSDGIELIDAGGGINLISGTSGGDVLDFSATQLVNIHSIDGGVGDDQVTGSASDDWIVGGPGNDNLMGGGGDDSIDDIEGSNLIRAGAGDDSITAAGNSLIDAGPGNDYIELRGGSNTIQFGPGGGIDTLYFDVSSPEDSTILEMASGLTADDVEIFWEENQWGDRALVIYLPASNDSLFASAYTYDPVLDEFEPLADASLTEIQFSDGTVISGDTLLDLASEEGGGEDDDFNLLVGTPGNDVLKGSSGDDVLIGGPGNDILRGGDGNDHFIIEGSDQGVDRFMGGDGNDWLLGGESDDVITMSKFVANNSIELIDGGPGVNVISGNSGSNIFKFSATQLFNIAAIDTGEGDDKVRGSQGDDVIIGGQGDDKLSGARGNDRYLFALGDGRDVINNKDPDPDSTDELVVSGADFDDLWLSRKGNHLVVDVVGSNDQIRIKNWFSSEDGQLDALYTDDHLLLRNQVDLLVNAMAVYDVPEGIDAIIPLEARTELDPVLASAWQVA